MLGNKIINPLICGNIYKISGNQMPDPDRDQQLAEAVSGDILIYALTNISETKGNGVDLFTKINTRLIKKVTSSKNGRFCVNFPPGKYSFFIQNSELGIYANIFDNEMNICPIEVKKANNTDIVLKINHSATY